MKSSGAPTRLSTCKVNPSSIRARLGKKVFKGSNNHRMIVEGISGVQADDCQGSRWRILLIIYHHPEHHRNNDEEIVYVARPIRGHDCRSDPRLHEGEVTTGVIASIATLGQR